MATPIRIKRSAVPAKAPVNSDLVFGELGLNSFDGRVFLKQDQGKLGIGTRIIEVGAGSRIGKTIFVTISGSDENSGLNEIDSKATIKSAASIALPGDTIKVYPGIYLEDNPITLARNVSVEGTELRNCIVTPKNVNRDLFYVNNSCHVTDISFRLDDGRDMTDGSAVIAFEPLLGVATDRFFDASRMIRYNLDYIAKESVGFLTSGFSGFAGNHREQDAARLIDLNINFIASEAVGFITSNNYDSGNFRSLLPNPEDCRDDIVDVFSAVSNDLKANSNKKSIGAGLSYFSNEGTLLHVTGIATQAATIAALNYAIGVATHVINNQSLSLTYGDISQQFDTSITNVAGGCVGVGTTISQLVGIVTNMIGSGSTSSAPEIRFGVNLDSGDCADDVKDVWKAICHDITRGGNSKCVDAASKYYDSNNNLITTFLKNPGEVDQTIATLDYSFKVARAVVNNSSWGGRPVGVGTSVANASYDGNNGVVTILAPDHGLSVGDAVRISGLGFSCSTGGPINFPSGKYGYIFNVQSVTDSDIFDVVIGKSTIPHTYISGGKVEKYKNFQDDITQLKDVSIQADYLTGFNNSVTGCSNVISAMHTCVGIVTDIVRHSPSIVGTQFKKSYPGNRADGFADTIGITSAVYNERTGNLYLESEGGSFIKGDRVELRNLNFESLSGGSISTQSIPSGKLGNEFYIDTLNEDGSFIVNVGTSTLPYTYVSGGFIVDRSIGVTTASYDNSTGIASIGAPGLNVKVGDTVEVKDLQFSAGILPSGENGYNFKVLEITGIKTSYDVNNSTYNPSTGTLQLSILGGHNLSDGDRIKIEDNSLTFVCSDNFEKVTYPRTSDPSSGRYLPVTVIGAAGFTVNVGTSTFVNYDISNAIYNPNNGNLDLTIGAHTLRKGTSVRLNDNSLTFTCSQDSNATNHTYPRTIIDNHTAQDASYNTFTGIMEVTTTSDHGMRDGDWVKFDDNSLSFSCTYGSGPHTFVSGVTNSITAVSGGVPVGSFTADDLTTYDPVTGIMILEIGSHSLTTSDSIQIADNSLTFTCDADNYATQHTYPRPGDPASGANIPIISTTSTTITVNVGAVSNSQTKTYPRSSDAISGRWVKVFNVTNNTFSVPVLNIIPSTNNSPHTFISAVTDGIKQKRDRSYDAPIKITGVGATTISLNVGISSNLSSHTFVSALPDALKTGGNYAHTFISAESDAITSDNSKISVNVGTSTLPHTYVSGGIVRPPYSPGVGPISQGPYIRNCTNFIPKSIGMRIDGFDAEPADKDDIGVTGSMSVDSFTQFNQSGIGVSITNGAYAQLVSIFTICDEIAIFTESGGQCDLTNSNSSFGNFGLVSKGVGDQTTKSIYRYTGIANTTSEIDSDLVVISGLGNQRPYDGQAIFFGELFNFVKAIKVTNPGSGYVSPPRVTISSPSGPQGVNAEGSSNINSSGEVTSVDIIADGSQYRLTDNPTVTFELPPPGGVQATGEIELFPIFYSIESATKPSSGISTVVLNQRLNNTVSIGTTVYLSRVSLQITSSHSFEWVGSGNDIDFAKPGLGGVVIQENEVIERGGGRVVYTSTDQAGNFRIGDGLVANQLTGTISGRSFDQSIINKVNPLIIALG